MPSNERDHDDRRVGHAPRLETLAVSHGERGRVQHAEDVVVPIHLTSTYAVDGIDAETTLEDVDADAGDYVYGRLANPTRRVLERRLAALEGGEHGLAFASGTAAVVAAVMAHVEPGAHVVAFEDLYGGTKKLLTGLFAERLGVDVSFVDARDPATVADAVRAETALCWMETPTNPLMRLCDVAAIAEIAHGAGAALGVDNTFASPALQRPLDLGADVVVHSTTKYLNGHSDAIGGALVTDDDDLLESVGFLQQVALGTPLAPFDAYLTLRGIRTLPLRMDRHEANATAIAEFLAEHPAVETVHYPGLPSHPQHDLAARQMDGFGGMVSFEPATDVDGVARLCASLSEIPLAVSLGGVESLIEHPASMTHSTLSPAERERVGISDSLLRLSVGIEHHEDLIADLDAALAAI
jgi:cystathionine gamma-lyase